MGDISRYKHAVRAKQAELRSLLNEWDPIGIGDIPDAPTDEYDCLLGIISKLQRGMTERQLSRYLKRKLKHHFGIPPDPHRPAEFAKQVYAWYWKDPLPS